MGQVRRGRGQLKATILFLQLERFCDYFTPMTGWLAHGGALIFEDTSFEWRQSLACIGEFSLEGQNETVILKFTGRKAGEYAGRTGGLRVSDARSASGETKVDAINMAAPSIVFLLGFRSLPPPRWR